MEITLKQINFEPPLKPFLLRMLDECSSIGNMLVGCFKSKDACTLKLRSALCMMSQNDHRPSRGQGHLHSRVCTQLNY